MALIATKSNVDQNNFPTGIVTLEGKLNAEGLKFALVASRFNSFIVDQLISGTIDCLSRHGAKSEDLTLIKVPGAFEIVQAVRNIAEGQKHKFDAVICLGAIIRGATPHFDLLSSATVKMLAQINLNYGVPIGLGILTTDTQEQAVERAGAKAGNKGAEAALACLELVRVIQQLKD